MEATQIPLEWKRHMLTWSHISQTHIPSLGNIFHLTAFSFLAESQMRFVGSSIIWPADEGGEGSFSGQWQGEGTKEVRWPRLSPARGWVDDSVQVTSYSEYRLAYLKNEKMRPTFPWKTFLALTSFKQDKILQSSHKHLLWSGSYQGSKLMSWCNLRR